MSVALADAASAASTRARQIAASASMALDARAKALKAAGQPIISFGVGEPDFPDARADQAGRRPGHGRQRHPLHHRQRRSGAAQAGRRADRRDRRACPSPGARSSPPAAPKKRCTSRCRSLCDPGDEVLLPAAVLGQLRRAGQAWPARPSCRSTPARRTGSSRPTTCAATSPRAAACWCCARRAIPTGAVYSDAELAALAEVLAEHDMAVARRRDLRAHQLRARRPLAARRAAAGRSQPDRRRRLQGVRHDRLAAGLAGRSARSDADRVGAAEPSDQPSVVDHPARGHVRAGEQRRGRARRRRDGRHLPPAARRDRGRPSPASTASSVPPSPKARSTSSRTCAACSAGRSARRAASSIRPTSCARICSTKRWLTAVPGEAFGTPGFIRLSYALAMDQLQEGVERLQTALAAPRLHGRAKLRLRPCRPCSPADRCPTLAARPVSLRPPTTP